MLMKAGEWASDLLKPEELTADDSAETRRKKISGCWKEGIAGRGILQKTMTYHLTEGDGSRRKQRRPGVAAGKLTAGGLAEEA